MPLHFRGLTQADRKQIRLVVTDVDGTITWPDGRLHLGAVEALQKAEEHSLKIGLVSGRPMCQLNSLAQYLGVTGPVIAENGAVARVRPDAELVQLPYSKEVAKRAFARLRQVLKKKVQMTEDSRCRMVDIAIERGVVDVSEIEHILKRQKVNVFDSGVMIHLVDNRVSKGNTLKLLIPMLNGPAILPRDVLVLGDSLSDRSMFEMFESSVLIRNPRIPRAHVDRLEQVVRYASTHLAGDGFAEVLNYVVSNLR
jgi:hydroxymethylpyrimidine pyrophosphatase-like HAD family hydrolase